MKQTAKFKLSQWDAADRILMQDFNADNLKIETALAAHAAALTARGNCRMETQTYTGTGECGSNHPTRINFSARPDFFVIFGGRSIAMGVGGEKYITSLSYTSGQSYSFGGSTYAVTWSGNQMSLQTGYMEDQLNATKTSYYVVAFYKLG